MDQTQTESRIVEVERGKAKGGTTEQRIEFEGLNDPRGNPIQYVTVSHPYPNRATRRKNGIRLPLELLLGFTGLQQQALELEDEGIEVPAEIKEALSLG